MLTDEPKTESETEPESTGDAESVQSPEKAADDVREAARGLRELFSTLVPPDEIEIQDAFGGRYCVRAVLPARRQIVVMRQIESLLSAESGVKALTATGSGIEGIAAALISLATNEVVLDGICRAFGAAHPDVVKQAQARAMAVEVPKKDATHPADLFAIEELVGGLLPFFLRLAAKIVDLFGTAIGAANETE